ncbi:MAG: hypothetical protein ACO29O_01725, partial [Chitinophagaceae bacterium]
MKNLLLFFLFFILNHSFVFSQDPFTLQVRDQRAKHESVWLQEYISFLSIPNLAADSVLLGKNATFIAELLKQQGIGNVQLLQAQTKGVPPAVYGEVLVPGAKQTIVFYAHYDGQPVDPSKWIEGLMPFKPSLSDGIMGSGGKLIALPEKGGG